MSNSILVIPKDVITNLSSFEDETGDRFYEIPAHLLDNYSQDTTELPKTLKSFLNYTGEGERNTLLLSGTSTKIPCKVWNTERGFNELIVEEVYGEMTKEEAEHRESGGFEIFITVDSFKRFYKEVYNIELSDKVIYSNEGIDLGGQDG